MCFFEKSFQRAKELFLIRRKSEYGRNRNRQGLGGLRDSPFSKNIPRPTLFEWVVSPPSQLNSKTTFEYIFFIPYLT